MADDEWIEVRRFDDPVEAEVTLNFLRDHGVSAAFRGNSGTTFILNRFNTVLDIRIIVPAADLDRARETLDAMVVQEPMRSSPPENAKEDDGAGPYRGVAPTAPSDAPSPTKRYRGAAVMLAIIPGGGHFYAQHTRAGVIYGTAIVSFYVVAATSGAVWLSSAALLCQAVDAIFGAVAVGRFNSGRVPTEGTQTLTAMLLVLLSVIVAMTSTRGL